MTDLSTGSPRFRPSLPAALSVPLTLAPPTLLLLIASFISCGGTRDDVRAPLIPELGIDRNLTVLEVDGNPVEAGEVLNAFATTGRFESLEHHARSDNETQFLLRFVTDFLVDRKIADLAREKEMDETPDYRMFRTRLGFNGIVDAFSVREILLNLKITEKDLRDFYEEVIDQFTRPLEYKIKYIFISAKKWGWEKAENRAKTVRDYLDRGRSFTELIYAYSDAKEPKDVDRGWYKAGELSQFNPLLEAAVLDLEEVGEYTPPVRGNNGYHFAMLSDRRESQVVSFEKARVLLREDFILREIESRLNELVKESMARMRVQRHYELLDQPECPEDRPVFLVEDFQYPIGLFRSVCLERKITKRTEQEQFLESEIKRAVIYKLAQERGYNRLDVEKVQEAKLNQFLRNLYVNRKVIPFVQVLESEILAEFSENPGRYALPTRIHPYYCFIRADYEEGAPRAQRLMAMEEAREFAERIYELYVVQQGMPFTDLARTYSNDPASRVQGGDMGLYGGVTMGRRFDQAAMNLKVGEITAPIQLADGYGLIWLRDRIPARQMDFEEARPTIRETLYKERVTTAMRELEEDLREELTIDANETSLQVVADALLRAQQDPILKATLVQ